VRTCCTSRQRAAVLNDVYREAVGLGIALNGVLVRAAGGFDTTTWHSTGIDSPVERDSPASDDELSRLLEAVDTIAEIPRPSEPGRRFIESRAVLTNPDLHHSANDVVGHVPDERRRCRQGVGVVVVTTTAAGGSAG
jgi:hypothetical protein